MSDPLIPFSTHTLALVAGGALTYLGRFILLRQKVSAEAALKQLELQAAKDQQDSADSAKAATLKATIAQKEYEDLFAESKQLRTELRDEVKGLRNELHKLQQDNVDCAASNRQLKAKVEELEEAKNRLMSRVGELEFELTKWKTANGHTTTN